MAIVNERFSRRPLAEMQRHSTQAGRFADQSIANAEVARALGMEADLSSRWANLSRKGPHNQLEVSRVSSSIKCRDIDHFIVRYSGHFLAHLKC